MCVCVCVCVYKENLALNNWKGSYAIKTNQPICTFYHKEMYYDAYEVETKVPKFLHFL